MASNNRCSSSECNVNHQPPPLYRPGHPPSSSASCSPEDRPLLSDTPATILGYFLLTVTSSLLPQVFFRQYLPFGFVLPASHNAQTALQRPPTRTSADVPVISPVSPARRTCHAVIPTYLVLLDVARQPNLSGSPLVVPYRSSLLCSRRYRLPLWVRVAFGVYRVMGATRRAFATKSRLDFLSWVTDHASSSFHRRDQLLEWCSYAFLVMRVPQLSRVVAEPWLNGGSRLSRSISSLAPSLQ